MHAISLGCSWKCPYIKQRSTFPASQRVSSSWARFTFVCYFRTCPNKLRTVTSSRQPGSTYQLDGFLWQINATRRRRRRLLVLVCWHILTASKPAGLPGALIVLYGFFLVPVVLLPRCGTSLALHIAPMQKRHSTKSRKLAIECW